MKYGVDGLKRRRIGVEKSSSSAATATATTSNPHIESPGTSEAALPPSTTGSGSVSEASRDECVFDHDLLDCSICIEHLQSPIFQCQNGHVACASCCKSTKNVCPSCQHPTGSIRCLVLEKLIESLKVKCSNSDSGCQVTVKYSERGAHEKICRYGSVSCPYKNCDFRDLPYNLFKDHVKLSHPEHCDLTVYDASDEYITLKPKERFCIIVYEQLCFVLHRNPVVTVKGNYERSLGDMCYISVLKVLSERYAGEIPYKMKLKTLNPDESRPTSTFTVESVCSVDDDDPENFLRDDGFVVVAQDMLLEIDIEFFALDHS